MANPSLQLRLTQKLALAPQLQQAIRLLQLNRIELRDYIQELVDANPLLDHEENPEQTGEDNEPVSLEAEMAETRKAESEREYSDEGFENEQWQADTEQWTDTAGWSDNFTERQIADSAPSSLREHLLAQIQLAHFSELDAAIATAIVYALDDDGFLTEDIPGIRASMLPEVAVEDDEIIAVLHRVQRLNPLVLPAAIRVSASGSSFGHSRQEQPASILHCA